MKISFLLVLPLLLLSACQSTQQPSAILTDSTCEPPCWNTITPGKTTKEEAIKIINTSGFIRDKIDEESQGHQFGLEFFAWNFNHNGSGVIFLQQGKVFLIEFGSKPKESMFDRVEEINVTLSQAIEKYGEPEVVFSAFNPDIPAWGWITFLYPEQGLDFYYSSHIERTKYQNVLRPETPISSINYYLPENSTEIFDKFFIGKSEWTEEEVNASIYPWKGYGSIAEKYPTAFGSDR